MTTDDLNALLAIRDGDVFRPGFGDGESGTGFGGGAGSGLGNEGGATLRGFSGRGDSYCFQDDFPTLLSPTDIYHVAEDALP